MPFLRLPHNSHCVTNLKDHQDGEPITCLGQTLEANYALVRLFGNLFGCTSEPLKEKVRTAVWEDH